MLYHASRTAGLKTLQPHVSTHKKAYVYGICDPATALLFGAGADDFDLIIQTDEEDIPAVFECYPNALEAVYSGRSCSLYEVDERGFERAMTSWTPELVCEGAVDVQSETVIDDIYTKLLEYEQRGLVELIRYERNDEYRRQIATHIVDRIIRFGVKLEDCLEQDERFSLYYKNIVCALRDATDGHLLP